jgi:hypothetical protein
MLPYCFGNLLKWNKIQYCVLEGNPPPPKKKKLFLESCCAVSVLFGMLSCSEVRSASFVLSYGKKQEIYSQHWNSTKSLHPVLQYAKFIGDIWNMTLNVRKTLFNLLFFSLHVINSFNTCEINLNKGLKCPDHQNKLTSGLFF